MARRGPGVVEALLTAVLGDAPPELRLSDIISVAGAVGALLEAATRNPNVAPRAGNALAILDAMVLGDLVLGLIEVLEGRADERLKQAASQMLIGIGEPAVERLKVSLRDRDAAPWVVDTLVEIRDGRTAAQPASDADRTGPDDRGGGDAGRTGTDDRGVGEAGRTGAADPDADDRVTDGGAPAPSAAPPGGDDIDREFAAFLDRFKRETGQS